MDEMKLLSCTMEEIIVKKAILLQELNSLNHRLIVAKQGYKRMEDNLLLKTDFKAEGCTNERQRTAFINQELTKEKDKLIIFEFKIESIKNDITILNDLLKVRLTEKEFGGE